MYLFHFGCKIYGLKKKEGKKNNKKNKKIYAKSEI